MKKVMVILVVMLFGLINFAYADKIINNNNNGESCSESELQAKYEAGKQFCIDNPSKCGLSEKDEDAEEDDNDDVCAQVITYGKAPDLDCWIAFPTPCDIPESWETRNSAPDKMCELSENESELKYTEEDLKQAKEVAYNEGLEDGKADCDNDDDSEEPSSVCADVNLENLALTIPCVNIGTSKFKLWFDFAPTIGDSKNFYWKFNKIEPIALENDADGDGYTVEDGDCNDNNASIHPGMGEIMGDGVDQNCEPMPFD